jgi:hypothetical protein
MQTKTAETKNQVPITTRAIVQRINRKLATDDRKLVKLRGRAAGECGDWVVVPIPNRADVRGWGRAGPLSRVEQYNVDLDALGREIGVLRPWEMVAEGGQS